MSANDAQMQQFLEVRLSSRRRLYVVVTRRNERKNGLTQSSSHSFRRTRAQEEKRKAVFNEVVAKLTDTCFEKCVTYAPGAKFSSSEASCLTNCALRYLESGRVVLERLQGGR